MKAYQLLITLNNVKPAVWRRVIIPAETHFKRLHDTIQFAMGWQDYHLYEFEIDYGYRDCKLQIVGFDETYEEHLFMQQQYLMDPPVEEGDVSCMERIMRIEMRKARATRLPKYLETYPEFRYLYDYGDDWEHSVKVEKVIEDYPFGHPTLLEGEGACPPEDVGGSSGYEEFLEAWNNPSHPEHEQMYEWGKSQRYRELDIPRINKVMESILKLKKVMSQ